jgi:AraC family transcriptional activator of pobA
MLKNLINTELKNLPIAGLNIYIVKKYVVKTSSKSSFKVKNLSVLLIKSGKLKIQLQEIITNLSARDLLVIPKDSFCTIVDVEDKLQLFLISFSADFAFQNKLHGELVDSFYFFVKKASVKITLEEKEFLVLSLIYKLIYFVNKSHTLSSFDYELQRISFNLFLFELKMIYSKYNSQVTLNFSRKESLAIQFLTILSIHYKRQHNVSFYSGALFISSDYLTIIIKEMTGKTAKKVIVEKIVTEAKYLLDDSQLSIVEIAEYLEFSDASRFCRFFKKHSSFSASEYRSNTTDKF